MQRETIDRLLDLYYKATAGGYGIVNTIKRINMFYGDPCRLEISSEPGEYTEARVYTNTKIYLGALL